MTFLSHLSDAMIQRLVEGALSTAEADAAKIHIEVCVPCRRRSGELSALFTALSAPRVQPEPPVDFLAAVMARVDREPGLVESVFRPRVVALSVSAGIACAGFGAALAFAAGGFDPDPGVVVAATALTSAYGKAGLFATIVKAAAPILAAAALASVAALSPLFVRALREVTPSPTRATARI